MDGSFRFSAGDVVKIYRDPDYYILGLVLDADDELERAKVRIDLIDAVTSSEYTYEREFSYEQLELIEEDENENPDCGRYE